MVILGSKYNSYSFWLKPATEIRGSDGLLRPTDRGIHIQFENGRYVTRDPEMERKIRTSPVVANIIRKNPADLFFITEAELGLNKDEVAKEPVVNCQVEGCDFVGKNEKGLKTHCSKRHKKEIVAA